MIRRTDRLGRPCKHGMCGTPEYRVWLQMWQRCTNPKTARYDRYGGRGIRVCNQWRSFESFYLDVGPRPSLAHTLDRRDNNGNYEPSNVCWSLPDVQNNNKSDTRLLTFHGKTQSAKQWALEIGMNPRTLINRLLSGWTAEDALSIPVESRVWTKSPANRRHVSAFGETKTIAAWSRDPRCSVSLWTLRERIDSGWTIEQALSTPLMRCFSHPKLGTKKSPEKEREA